MPGLNHQQEDNFPLTEEELRRAPNSTSLFIKSFTPPPRYPGTESHEMKNLAPPSSESTLPQVISERPAQEERFDFQFYAPKKNMRRYLVPLVIFLTLTIAVLAALTGILGHQLHSALHDSQSQNTTLTVTVTQSLRFTTVHPTTLLTITRSLASSTLEVTQTEIQTEYQTESVILSSPSPLPTPTLDTSPHATCSAVSIADGGFDVRIWSNYINSDDLALALAVAIDKQCGGQIDATGWNTTAATQTWTEGDNTVWVSDNKFELHLEEVALSDALQCVPKAIIDAGGPPNTSDCD